MKNAPITPVINPRTKNHGNCVKLLKSNFSTSYHGLIPKKLRDTIDATTDEHTSGANKFIEKFPSTIIAANTAPAIGALYAAEIPAAAPHAVNSRNRYGCHRASWPHFDAYVAASCVIAPSRPIDPPLPMVTSEEPAFTSAVRNGSRPSLVATTSMMLLEPCFPASRNPQ